MRAILLLLLICFNLQVHADEEATNPYTTGYSKRMDAPAGKPWSGEVKIFKGSDKDRDYLRLLEDGYDLLGLSSFKAGEVPPDQAAAQAREIKADVVMVYTNRFGKVPDAVKMEAARNKLKNKSDYGAAPEFELLGNMEYGFEYYATFWTKLLPPLLGVHVNDRPQGDKTPGVPVVAVIKNSPAAAADIRGGDEVLRIGTQETNNGESLVKAVRDQAGKTVEVTWSRDGSVMHTPVTLGTP